MTRMFNPPHPGRQLKEALETLPITVTEFAKHIGITRGMLSRVLNEKAGITAEMSMKLGEAFDNTPDLWFKMQVAHDFWVASQAKRNKVGLLRRAA